MAEIYSVAAPKYRARGWEGTLPVDGKKENLPSGFTGRDGKDPDDSEVKRWVRTRGASNIVLRLPDDVLGIDVDAYDNLVGTQTIDEFSNRYDVLPPTWKSTSRDANGSGIYFFRVPPGITWVSDLGHESDVQIIRRAHRYAVVWPSIHPQTRRVYQWYSPDGKVSSNIPTIDDLTELPESWVHGLSRKQGGLARKILGDSPREEETSYARKDHKFAEDEIEHYTRLDPTKILDGVAPGDQDNALYQYLCSLHARNATPKEMITLGLVVIQGFENSRPEDPWTPEHVISKVNRITSTYHPGNSLQQNFVINAGKTKRWLAGFTDGRTPRLTTHEHIEQSSEDNPGGSGTEIRVESSDRDLDGEDTDTGIPSGHGSVYPVVDSPGPSLDTDSGNALRFARIFRNRVRYAADTKSWYVWNGNHWESDQRNAVLLLTKEVYQDIRFQALTYENGSTAQRAVLTWAKTTEALPRRKAMLELAQAEPEIAIISDNFDRSSELLVVQNGTFNLETGTIQASKASDLCSKCCGVAYDPDATCPKWLDHIKFITQGDEELAEYMQTAMGYSISGFGTSVERAFFFLEGSGSNGKNAFIEPIIAVLGSYSVVSPSSLLTSGSDAHPTVIANIARARLVFVDETEAGKRINEERIKGLVGNRTVTARFQHQDYFEFVARFKLWMAGNGRPDFRDTSDGLWSRLHEIPMLGKVNPNNVIKDYGEVLFREEGSGILNWLIQGYQMWKKNGLSKPEIVKQAVKEHRNESDNYSRFIDECLVVGNMDDFVPSATLYHRWQLWCMSQGHKDDIGTAIGFMRAFGKKLAEILKLGKDEKVNVNKRYRVPGTDASKMCRGIVGCRFIGYDMEDEGI